MDSVKINSLAKNITSKHTIFFHNNRDAKIFSESIAQKHRVKNNQIFFEKRFDIAALREISRLTNIEFTFENACCFLPIPQDEWNERECLAGDRMIYVSDLSAYNEGIDFGIWLDCDRKASEILEDIQWMLSWSPVRHHSYCEEWRIDDYDGFGSYSINEHEPIESIVDLSKGISEYGLAYAAYSSEYHNGTLEEFKKVYRGEWESVQEYVLDHYKNCSYLDNLPEEIESCIDWNAIARNYQIDYLNVYESGNRTVYIFDK